MASTFKSEQQTGITGNTTIYTCPADTQAIIIGFHIANTGSENITVDIFRDLGTLGHDIPIPYGSTLIPFEGKMVLETGESIGITPSIDGVTDATMSILELT